MAWPKGTPRKPVLPTKPDPNAALPRGLQPREELPDAPTAQALSTMMGAGVLSDEQIRALCRTSLPDAMISPFVPHLVSEQDGARVLSYGTSSSGYDARLGDEFVLFDPPSPHGSFAPLDPLAWDGAGARRVKAQEVILPPGGFLLGHTVETFRMPRDLVAVCVGKSTHARCALLVNVTPIESGFAGQITIEISNLGHRPVILRAGQGVAQFLFLRTAGPVHTTYADRKGKYQDQSGVVTPR